MDQGTGITYVNWCNQNPERCRILRGYPWFCCEFVSITYVLDPHWSIAIISCGLETGNPDVVRVSKGKPRDCCLSRFNAWNGRIFSRWRGSQAECSTNWLSFSALGSVVLCMASE